MRGRLRCPSLHRSARTVAHLAEQHGSAKLLGGSLEPGRHIYVWREIGRVDFVLGADRALDRPSDVQPKAQPHLMVVY